MTKRIKFEDMREELAYQRQKRCVEGSEDIVIVIAGNEGSGKSIFALAIALIDQKFSAKQIFYFWKDYLKANQNTIKKLACGLGTEQVEKNNEYGLDVKDFIVSEGEAYDPGSVLLYDESATQMFNRSAMSKGNVSQVKLFIANRFLRLIHILCVPKIGSIDKYIRDERIKFFFYIVKENSEDMKSSKRSAYVWSRQSYAHMLNTPYWWKLFNSPKDLITQAPPDFEIELPDLTEPKYIKPEILKEYNAKKILFNLKQTVSMEEVDQNKEKKPKVIYADLQVQSGEDKWAWVKRTNKPPGAYKNYL